jgi:CheY-like chemotaxis protein
METPVTEEQLTHLNYITLSSQRLNSLVTDILDFARLESNDFEVELQEFKLSDLLNEIISSRMSAATSKGLQILVPKSESLVDSMTSDPVMIHRMVDILLSNAIKFTPSGHIKIQSRCNPTPSGHTLIIEVEDTGIGIHKEHQATLFLPFSQSDSSITRGYDGLGIGLTICHRLASLLKCQISVESEINLGSKFCLEIPVTPKNTPKPMTPATHYRIAVAEDCQTNAAMLKETLGSFGVKADFFANGTLMVQGSKIQAYDIILMDIYMPQMDGVEASKEIFNLNLKTGQNTYIIAVSASVTMSEKRRCQEAGIQDFISKPFRASDVRTAIEKAKQWLASKADLTLIKN